MAAGDLDASLAGAQRILVDSSVVIAFHDATDATHPLARDLFGRVERGGGTPTTLLSAVTAAEVLIRPLRAGTAQATRMRLFLTEFPHLDVVPVDLAVALEAASIRAQHNLALPDAFIAATAVVHSADTLVTNDERWGQRLGTVYPGLRWVYLAGHL